MSGENIFICYAKQDRIYVDAIATEASKYKGLNLLLLILLLHLMEKILGSL